MNGATTAERPGPGRRLRDSGPCGMLERVVELFPPVEPYEHGLLDVGDGNLVYWEACGTRTASAIRAA